MVILKNISNNKNGFTLIEIMLAITILLIVISMTSAMIVEAFKIVLPSSKRMGEKQMLQIKLTRISEFARSANKIEASTNKIIFEEGGSEVEIKKVNKKILKNNDLLLNNVSDFIIKENNDVYSIKIIKYIDNKFEDTIEAETQVWLRNKKDEN